MGGVGTWCWWVVLVGGWRVVLVGGVDGWCWWVALVGGVGGWCWWVVLVSLITQCVINNGS